MRRVGWMLVLGVLAVLGIGPVGGAARCDSSATGADGHKPPKPSALAPRHNGGSHVYGAPIQQPIFRSRPKPKSAQSGAGQGPQPQH
jgi:hypothetical protein